MRLLLFLPNVAVMDDQTLARIERTLKESPDVRIVAEGSFGMYAANGTSSYGPPEGLADAFGVRVADFSRVTELDIEQHSNILETSYGQVAITSPTGYAVLEGRNGGREVAALAA